MDLFFYSKVKYFILICILSIIFNSCTEDLGENSYIQNTPKTEVEARNSFAQILSKALYDEDIRKFIREEALKQIDNDYDVIYHYVKNVKLSNGLTFRENLSKYSPSLSYLDSIANKDQLLTILVPYLGDTFSPENWDASTQIPKVAVRNTDKEDELLTFDNNIQLHLNRKTVPDFPVVVVKTNDRLIISKDITKSSNINYLTNDNSIIGYFLDESFNNTPNKEKAIIILTPGQLYVENFSDEKMFNASFIKGNDCIRDYLYYNINSAFGQNKGTLDNKYREYIKSIEFESPGSYSHIADSFDPNGDWTDGNLEIQFDFIFINKEGGASTITKMRSVPISELFHLRRGGVISTFRYELPNPIEVFCWDMYTFGSMYKISLSEYDNGSEIERTESISSTFSLNFEVTAPSINLGIFKMGAKFGGSWTENKQSSTKVKTTNNSDPLGEIYVNFFDPFLTEPYNESMVVNFSVKKYDQWPSTVIINENRSFSINEYGKYLLYIEDCKRRFNSILSNDIGNINKYTGIVRPQPMDFRTYTHTTGILNLTVETMRIN